MARYIIETDNLEYKYPDGTKALQGVSLNIPEGSKIALLGPNGAGKSTLFLHFNGIFQPTGGLVKYRGVQIKYDRKSLLELRKKVGIVFQDPDTQLFSASVFQEISFGPLNIGLSKEEACQMVNQAMAETGISDLKDKPTHFLSYGQKKRVAIADVLAMKPEVIICDEPNVWLDPKHSRQLEALFNELNKNGKTIIISTHDVDLAFSWADYIIVIDSGKVIGQGSPEEIFTDEILLKKANLERPWVFDISCILAQKGVLDPEQPLPRTRKELIKKINNAKIFEGIEDKDDFSIIGDQRGDGDYFTISCKRK